MALRARQKMNQKSAINGYFQHAAVCLLRRILLAGLVVLGAKLSGAAELYNPPTNPRTDILLNAGWQFVRQDVPNAQSAGFNDSTWTTLNLPHTWNNLDGQDGLKDYYRHRLVSKALPGGQEP
jgi:hypothetical protein